MIAADSRSQLRQANARRNRHDSLDLAGKTVRAVGAIRHIPEPSAFPIEPFEMRDRPHCGFCECPGRAGTIDLAGAVGERVDIGATARSHEVLRCRRELGDALAGARPDEPAAAANSDEFKRRVVPKDGRRRHQRVATEPDEAELGVEQRLAEFLLEDRERLLGDRNGPFDGVRNEPVFAQSVDGAADEVPFMLGCGAKRPVGLGLALAPIPAKAVDDGLDVVRILFDSGDGIAQRFGQALRNFGNFAVDSFESHFDRYPVLPLQRAAASACRLDATVRRLNQRLRFLPRDCRALQPPTTVRRLRDPAPRKKSGSARRRA